MGSYFPESIEQNPHRENLFHKQGRQMVFLFLLPSLPQPNPACMFSALPKITKWTEFLGITVCAVGYVFKVMHYAGANELLLLGFLTLASTYLVSGFIVIALPDGYEPKSFFDLLPILLRKVMYLALSVYLLGILFKILHLGGANPMLLVGVATLAIGLLLSVVLIVGNRQRMEILMNPLARSVFLVFVFF
jgi:hypothetical protein